MGEVLGVAYILIGLFFLGRVIKRREFPEFGGITLLCVGVIIISAWPVIWGIFFEEDSK